MGKDDGSYSFSREPINRGGDISREGSYGEAREEPRSEKRWRQMREYASSLKEFPLVDCTSPTDSWPLGAKFNPQFD